MTLGELLQQFAGQGESDPQAAAYLRNPQSRPEITNRGRMASIPPMHRSTQGLEHRNVPIYRTQQAAPDPVFPWQAMPQRVRQEGPPASVMGSYANFADYANNEMGLGRPASGAPSPPPQGVGGYSINPATGHPMNPPATAMAQPETDPNLQALMDALAHARAQTLADRRSAMAELPRPGRPAIAGLFWGRRNGR